MRRKSHRYEASTARDAATKALSAMLEWGRSVQDQLEVERRLK
jgi:hypothetical protein